MGMRKTSNLGIARPALIAAIVGAALLLLLPLALKNYGVYLLSYWLVFVIATMGLNLTVGYAGQKSLGHAAFFGIGAYTVAILLKLGVSWWLGLPAAAILCFVVGLGLGFPALRVQTIYLAFATLGFNTAVWLVMRNEEWLTGGTFGINNIARPELFGLSLEGNRAYYYVILAFAVILSALLWGLLRSPWGKAFTALRDNPIRAESLGVNIRSYTLLSFAIGAVYAGVAGGLFASLVQFIEPAPFTVGASIMMYLMVVVGGPGYFWGPVLGAAVGVVVPEWLRDVPGVADWYLPLFGAAVVGLMVWLPEGLLSLPDRIKAKQQAKVASAERAAAGQAKPSESPEKLPEKVPKKASETGNFSIANNDTDNAESGIQNPKFSP
jgi:branched-chain amino acid transport system permease protein